MNTQAILEKVEKILDSAVMPTRYGAVIDAVNIGYLSREIAQILTAQEDSDGVEKKICYTCKLWNHVSGWCEFHSLITDGDDDCQSWKGR